MFSMCASITSYKFNESNIWKPDLQKPESTHVRYELILASFNLMKSHPLGVGSREFEFAVMPHLHKMMPEFNEGCIPHAPHNEYLRFIVEEGIPYTLICILFGLALLYDRRKTLYEIIQQHPILPAFFTFWTIQCAFQFPFTNGLSFLIFCFMLSNLFSLLYHQQESLRIRIPIALKILTSGIFALLFCCVLISEYLTLNYSDSIPKTKLAYTLNGQNWYAGIYHAVALMHGGHLDEARIELTKELEKRPHNFVALRELAHIEMLENNHQLACKHLKQYDLYFGNKSSYTPTRLEFCENQ